MDGLGMAKLEWISSQYGQASHTNLDMILEVRKHL